MGIFPPNTPVWPVGFGTSVTPVSAILSGMFAPVAAVAPVDDPVSPVAPVDVRVVAVSGPVASVDSSVVPCEDPGEDPVAS